MKNLLLIFAFLLMSTSAFAQTVSDISTATLLSPFVSATKLLETSAVSTLAALQSTRSLVQSRGVAGKEQIKDELVTLNGAMMMGRVKLIAEVEEPALRELFEEISGNEEQMEEINSVVQEGSELHRVATAVTAAMMME